MFLFILTSVGACSPALQLPLILLMKFITLIFLTFLDIILLMFAGAFLLSLHSMAKYFFLVFISFKTSLLYYSSRVFHPPTLAVDLSLESKWLHVSLGLQDSSQYSNRPKQCCNLDGLGLSSDFQLLQPFTKLLEIVPRAPITMGIAVTFMFFSSLAISKCLSPFFFLFCFLGFSHCGNTLFDSFSFFFFLVGGWLSLGLVAGIWWYVSI